MIPCKCIRSACMGISSYIMWLALTTQLLSGTDAMLILCLAHLSPSPSYTLLQHFRLYCVHISYLNFFDNAAITIMQFWRMINCHTNNSDYVT